MTFIWAAFPALNIPSPASVIFGMLHNWQHPYGH
jgi:hypothetical protein